MTEHEAFLAAICAEPLEDSPRLIFADFLELNGDGVRGEFIRIQCELAKYPVRGGRREAVGTKRLPLSVCARTNYGADGQTSKIFAAVSTT